MPTIFYINKHLRRKASYCLVLVLCVTALCSQVNRSITLVDNGPIAGYQEVVNTPDDLVSGLCTSAKKLLRFHVSSDSETSNIVLFIGSTLMLAGLAKLIVRLLQLSPSIRVTTKRLHLRLCVFLE
ncbi:hypothetical protein [Photobacterium minamisatsumaniensis]|uniref:hypothetical protein n=1 Tax=Photobacterium minamisatsumaniensis TaxID=2910233 RepID=UPI003D0AAA3D